MAGRSYAVRACDYCDVEVPGNELHPVTDRVVSGERRGSRNYISSRGTVGHGSSNSTYYKLNHLKICGECYDLRAAAIRRQRLMSFLGTCFVIALIIGAITFLRSSHSAQSPASNMADDLTSANATTLDSGPVANENASSDTSMPQPVTSDSPSPPPDRASQESMSDAAPMNPDQPSPVSRFRDDPHLDDYARAINGVTPKALESGQPESWAAAGAKGYVVPGPSQTYAGKTCRNVYSTRIFGGDQSQSAAVLWCRDGDAGEWHLSN